MITVKEVKKKYGTVTALNNISTVIEQGEITGILGPNGAGKTTLLKIITCYMFPTSGNIMVDGLDIYNNSLRIRQKIGYLPENAPVYSDLTVLEYLRFIGSIRNIGKKELPERIRKVSGLCDIGSVAYKRIDALSKGYRQRVGLAQALIHDPEILILDEPTSGLDPNQIQEIRELIKALGKEKTTLFSSHILQEVQAVCDRALILNKGNIVADGAPDELDQTSGKYKQILLSVICADDIIEDIKGLMNVESAETVSTADQALSYRIKSSGDSDIRESLFDLCVNKNAKIIELHKEKDSLEKVFRELTL